MRSSGVGRNPMHLPCSNRPSADRLTLQGFWRDLRCVDDLSNAIANAFVAIGLGVGGSAFSVDILRSEVRALNSPHLTIVDLPGSIRSECKFQSAEENALINSLGEGYIEQGRSMVLTVISAKNDHAN